MRGAARCDRGTAGECRGPQRRHRARLAVGIVLMLAGCSTATIAPPFPTSTPEDVGLSSERLARIDAFIARMQREQKVAGAVTLVARRGKLVSLKAHGLADLETQRAVRVDAACGMSCSLREVDSSLELADNKSTDRGWAMADAQQTLLELFYGRWRSQTLYVGVKLGVLEVVGADRLGLEYVAQTLGIDSALGYRLLRALAALGVLCEHDGKSFSSTPAGQMLRSDHPQSMRDAFLLREGPEHTAVWKHLIDIVRDGKQTGFVREFGMSAFAYADRERSYGDAFSAGMSSQSNLQTIWTIEALRTCDLRSVSHLCDVGGGRGHLLCHVLSTHPSMRGTVLERAQVVGQGGMLWAEKLYVADRCTFVAGDMFTAVPAADAYALKMILHDWDDAECTRILDVLRRCAVRPARIFIVEHVIPEQGGPDYAAMFDMHMMCWGTGRERSAAEYRDLLEAAGWSFKAVWFPPSGAIGVVEGGLAP